MGKRLTKIATRTGDDGTTGLGDGARVPKDGPRIEALGEIDELNSTLGVLLAELLPDDVRSSIVAIQHDLFDLGGEVCIPGHRILTGESLARLDALLHEYNAKLPALAEFILPSGSRAGTLCNLARAVCRRAERSLIKLARTEAVNALGHQYLNRLSDLLFVLARVINRASGSAETYWRSRKLAAKANPS